MLLLEALEVLLRSMLLFEGAIIIMRFCAVLMKVLLPGLANLYVM